MRKILSVPPKPGDERDVTKFLFLPVIVLHEDGESQELRWLERATVHQIRRMYGGWHNKYFVDEEESK